jgi:small-conductance mechanosensitive channel
VIIYTVKELILRRYDIQAKDNLKARAVHTQVNVLVRIALVVVSFIAFSAILMMFESIRTLGASLLASAGVVGVIVGFAAQKSIAALLAGLQVAVTQPIRIDDVVIVDGEWGQVEEINLTYVVIRIWDLRRLIVPISHFLEKSFQNWTRISADLLGSVYLYADYTLPVQPVRNELHRILARSPHWDGKVWRLHVTNLSEKTVELRALMSARDSSTTWELRCEVREQLLDYLQRHHGDCLPKTRAEVTSVDVPRPGRPETG